MDDGRWTITRACPRVHCLSSILLLVALLAGCTHAAAPDMVYVPARAFIMGSTEGRADEAPPHQAEVAAFSIDRHEVTVAEYAAFLTARGSLWCDGFPCADTQPDNPQSHLLSAGNGYKAEAGYEDHPVTWVSWYGAVAYCQWRGKRLPTEAEWEKAARGTDGRRYPWGNTYEGGRANAGGVHNGTLPVGSFPAGASPYGALDMAGNVWEWVADWYAPYPSSTYTSPFFGKYKVVRGGSWNHPVEDARTTARDIAHPSRRLGVVGFRCARGNHER